MRTKLIALGIIVAAAAALSAQPAYQLHDNGNLWVNTGIACSGVSCPGWVLLDNHPTTVEIAVAAGGVPADKQDTPDADPTPLYQRRSDGTVWDYTGTPCNNGACLGWRQIDDNQEIVSIVAASLDKKIKLYEHRKNGIWRYLWKPCSQGSCLGWEQLDNVPTAEIIATGAELYQRRTDGKIMRYKGTPCGNPTSCWESLDANSSTLQITATLVNTSVAPNVPRLYQRRADGTIWLYREESRTWQRIGKNTHAISIVAGTNKFGRGLFLLEDTGAIRNYTSPCADESPCTGWPLLDSNPQTRQIAAGPASLYQRRENGAILRYTGPECPGGSCWQFLDIPPMRTIVSSRN
ncbi:MAG TPA: hypothetical protein VKB93_11405 [Thermoanaerobaculia bacterium]|nr:hypothetical protein [Thermoanaerobaculia bacterium]